MIRIMVIIGMIMVIIGMNRNKESLTRENVVRGKFICKHDGVNSNTKITGNTSQRFSRSNNMFHIFVPPIGLISSKYGKSTEQVHRLKRKMYLPKMGERQIAHTLRSDAGRSKLELKGAATAAPFTSSQNIGFCTYVY
jgi:hypothetical protein